MTSAAFVRRGPRSRPWRRRCPVAAGAVTVALALLQTIPEPPPAQARPAPAASPASPTARS
ncbi:hypothetical protein ABZX96_35245, partial [Streptomyces sp. NPDC003077]